MPGTPDRDAVLNALRVVQDPDLRRDIVSLGFIKDLSIQGGSVSFAIELTTPACPVKDQLREQATAAVRAVAGVTAVDVRMTANVRSVSAPEHGRPMWNGMQLHIFQQPDPTPNPQSMGAIFPVVAPLKVNVKNKGEWNSFLYDAVGNTIELLNPNATVRQENLYDAFGKVLASTNLAINNRLRNTKERDSIPPKQGPGHLRVLMECLEKTQPGAETSLANVFHRLSVVCSATASKGASPPKSRVKNLRSTPMRAPRTCS